MHATIQWLIQRLGSFSAAMVEEPRQSENVLTDKRYSLIVARVVDLLHQLWFRCCPEVEARPTQYLVQNVQSSRT